MVVVVVVKVAVATATGRHIRYESQCGHDYETQVARRVVLVAVAVARRTLWCHQIRWYACCSVSVSGWSSASVCVYVFGRESQPLQVEVGKLLIIG